MRAASRTPDPLTGAVVYLGLGGNIPSRLDHLRRALFALATHPEIRLTAISRLFESQYVGPGEQAPYLNACVEVRTHLPPRVLLAVLKATEQRHGRGPDGHMRPRPIDLDILLYGALTSADPELTLPHPGLRERAFVLEPLADIAAAVRFPDSRETVGAACARIRRGGGPWVRLAAGRELLPWQGTGGEADRRAALALHRR